MILTASALAISAAFTGAAFYVNAVEQPARLALDDRALLAEWKPSYDRGALMQASLAIIGFLLGLAAWQLEHSALAALGAVFIILPWPITLLLIAPTNTRLKKTPDAEAGPESRALIKRWGGLHALRTLAGLAATLTFVAALAG
jgi:hypothetical protein